MYRETFCMEYFGQRLKEIRKKSGLSQDTLAQELGVSKGALCYYERGERIPDIVFLEKVANYYQVPLDYLMGFSDAINPKNAQLVDKTCLSEEAVDFLFNNFEYNNGGAILDKLIKNEKFAQAIDFIECESHSSYGHQTATVSAYSFNSPSYSVYILEKLLLDAIADVLEERSSEVGAIIMNSVIKPHERDQFYAWLFDSAKTTTEKKDKSDAERKEMFEEKRKEWMEQNKVRNQALEKLNSSTKEGD